MWDLVHHPMRSEEFYAVLVLIAVLGGFAVSVIKAVLAHIRRTKLDDMEATLKLEMVQCGMSAGDIERVLSAKVGGDYDAGGELARAIGRAAARRVRQTS